MITLLRALVSLIAILTVNEAAAQSVCPSIITGAIFTAAQWNVCFSNKQDVLGYSPLNSNGGVMTGPLDTVASTAGQAGLNVGTGVTITTPNNGDIWATSAGLFVQINGSTIGPLGGASSSSFAATSPLSVTFPGGVITYALATPVTPTFGGTGSNLSATGGSNQVVQQASVGAGLTVGQLGFSALSGTIGAGQFATVPGIVTLAMLNNAAASTLVGNTTTGSAVRTDFTIDGLTLKASPASTDEVIIWDVAGTAIKKTTVSGIGTSSGVSSIAGNTGAFTLGAGLTNSTNVLLVDTSYLPGFRGGLTLSNDGTNPNTTLDIASGASVDSTNAALIKIGTFTKLIKTQGGNTCTTAFVAGTGNCGMIAGVANSTWYHVFLIVCTGVADIYFDTSVTAANKPACASSFVRIGSILTNSSGNITSFTQFNKKFRFAAAPFDISTSTLTTSRSLFALSVPPGVNVEANLYGTIANAGNAIVWVGPPSATDAAPSLTATPGVLVYTGIANGIQIGWSTDIVVNTSQQIAARSDSSGTTLRAVTNGWTELW